MPKKKLIHWDSDCFLGLLKQDPDKIKRCKGTTAKAEEGGLVIVTSAITLIEVIKLQKGKVRFKAKDEKIIREFFKNPYINVHNVDSEIGLSARDLIWKHDLSQRDSIHVATALKLKISKMHTFDQKLHKLSNKHGNPKLKICRPDIDHQLEFKDLDKEAPTPV